MSPRTFWFGFSGVFINIIPVFVSVTFNFLFLLVVRTKVAKNMREDTPAFPKISEIHMWEYGSDPLNKSSVF